MNVFRVFTKNGNLDTVYDWKEPETYLVMIKNKLVDYKSSIADLQLSVKTTSFLESVGVKTVGQLVDYRSSFFYYDIPTLAKSFPAEFLEIKSKLREHGMVSPIAANSVVNTKAIE
jgi:DNA-directed RNA polymerase alpha subunit